MDVKVAPEMDKSTLGRARAEMKLRPWILRDECGDERGFR